MLPEPGKPQGFEETGSVSRDIPGVGITAQSSNFSNHTYEMDADNLKEIGHKGFTIDAEAMTALLFDFATHADYRAAVKKEFDGIKALFGEYQAALKKVYTCPAGRSPRRRSNVASLARSPTSCHLLPARSDARSTSAPARTRCSARRSRRGAAARRRSGHEACGSGLNAGRCADSPGIGGSPAK